MSDRPRQAPPPDDIRCERVKKSGERCRLAAAEGSDFCPYHGGGIRRSNAGAPTGSPKLPDSGGPPPKGSANAMTYGAFTPKLPAHLVAVRDRILAGYRGDMVNPNYADEMALERVASLEAKFAGAISDPDCPASTLDVLHRILHRELQALKATRASREQTSTGTSPAEVIGAILTKVAERRRQLEEGRQIQAPQGRVLQHVQSVETVEAVDAADDWPGDDDSECVDAEPWDGDQAEAEAEAEAEAGDDCDDEPDAREPTADESDDQDDSDWWPD